jgi:hypothetical protein
MNNIEVMKVPEISIQEEPGVLLFSLILKAKDPNYGESENKSQIVKETNEYFDKNPLDQTTIQILKEMEEDGIDEETLYNLSLTYEHDERVENVFQMMSKYKGHIKIPKKEWPKIRSKFVDVLHSFEKSFSDTSLAQKFRAITEEDKNKRLKNLEQSEEMISELIKFFKPDPKTTPTEKLIFLPTIPVIKKETGRAFRLGKEQIILSNIENVGNQKHEFLHGIINPIVDKLWKILSEEQKNKITELSSYDLKYKQNYGERPRSLLCEELIRTFNNVEDFKNKSQEYFDKFESNKLREMLFELYEEYSSLASEQNINFEQFILDKLPKLL